MDPVTILAAIGAASVGGAGMGVLFALGSRALEAYRARRRGKVKGGPQLVRDYVREKRRA